MKNKMITNGFSSRKNLFLKCVIVFSAFVLISCNLLSLVKEPFTQPTIFPEYDQFIQGELSEEQVEAAKSLISKAPGESEVYAREGVVNSLITGSKDVSDQAPQQQIESFFAENAELYQIDDFKQSFELTRVFDDGNGYDVRKYQQITDGIPVYQADIRVTRDSQGSIALINSNYMPDSHAPQSMVPTMTMEGVKAAYENLGFYLEEEMSPSLVVYSPVMVGEDGQSFLAWLSKAGWQGGYGDVLIKDSDGSLVSTSTDIKTFAYEIRDFGNKELGTYYFPYQVNIPTYPIIASSSPGEYPEAQSVSHLIDYYHQTINLYEKYFGYNHFSTGESKIIILLNVDYYGPFSVWKSDFQVPPIIGYVDADSEKGIDTFAHEFQHLVTQDFVLLETNISNPQASALNEALSDFFAAVADDSKNRWQIDSSGETLRSLKDPMRGVPGYSQPDHMDGFLIPNPNESDGDDSYGNGHLNSTIISHALYLLSEGGRKSDIDVWGIGIDNATKIIFNALPLLQTNTKFPEFRNAMFIACRNLSDVGELSSNDCNQVKNAFSAVGIGESARESNTPTNVMQGLQFGWGLSPILQLSNTFRAYEDIAHIGFVMVQEIFPWDQIQPYADGDINLDFGAIEKELWANYIRNNNLEVMATLIGAPWDENISDEEFLRLWRNYLNRIVPELTETVDYWQIGIQVNTNASWKNVRPKASTVDPELYGEMLKIAYEVIKVTENNDQVIFAGLNNLGGSKYFGLDPLEFLEQTLPICHMQCFDAIGLFIEWEDYLPDEKREIRWGDREIQVDMPGYINRAVTDIAEITGEYTPVWITGIELDSEWPSRLAEKKQIALYEAQSEIIVKTITSLANKSVQVIFYKDILDYDKTRVVSQDIYSLVYLLSRSEPLGRFPVYSTNGEILDQVTQYRFRRNNAPDVALVWTEEESLWGVTAKVETIEDINANMQRFIDFPNAGDITNIGFESVFYIQQGITLLLGEMDNNDKLVIGELNTGGSPLPQDSIFYIYEGNIWVINEDGTGQTAITTDGNYKEVFSAPDGNQLAFIRASVDPDNQQSADEIGIYELSTNSELIVVPPEKTGTILGSYYSYSNPRWTKDSTTIYFVKSDGRVGGNFVHSVNIGSLQEEINFSPFFCRGFDVSPRDDQIIYIDFSNAIPSGYNLNLANPDGSGSYPLFPILKDVYISNVTWTRDGQHIIFLAKGGEYGDGAIIKISPDSTLKGTWPIDSLGYTTVDQNDNSIVISSNNVIYIFDTLNGKSQLLTEGYSPSWKLGNNINGPFIITDDLLGEYGQFMIENWGWNSPIPHFYLTYDKQKWDPVDSMLVSKDFPNCHIGPQGFRDGGPYAELYTHETVIEIIGDTEFFIEREIPPNGIADLTHIYWDDYRNQFTFYTGPEYSDECTMAFWEVLGLSESNNFGFD